MGRGAGHCHKLLLYRRSYNDDHSRGHRLANKVYDHCVLTTIIPKPCSICKTFLGLGLIERRRSAEDFALAA